MDLVSVRLVFVWSISPRDLLPDSHLPHPSSKSNNWWRRNIEFWPCCPHRKLDDNFHYADNGSFISSLPHTSNDNCNQTNRGPPRDFRWAQWLQYLVAQLGKWWLGIRRNRTILLCLEDLVRSYCMVQTILRRYFDPVLIFRLLPTDIRRLKWSLD